MYKQSRTRFNDQYTQSLGWQQKTPVVRCFATNSRLCIERYCLDSLSGGCPSKEAGEAKKTSNDSTSYVVDKQFYNTHFMRFSE